MNATTRPGKSTRKGLEETTDRLRNLGETLISAGAQGLAEAALVLLDEAARRAPAETAALRGSGYAARDGAVFSRVEQPDLTGRAAPPSPPSQAAPAEALRIQIGFDADCAALQHEQTANPHPHGGRAKYLESTMVEQGDRVLAVIAQKAQEALMSEFDQ